MSTKRGITIAAAFVAGALTLGVTGTLQAQQFGQCNQLGCYRTMPSGRTVFVYTNGRIEDLATHIQFLRTRNGVMAFTHQGWMPIASVQNAPQVWAAIVSTQVATSPRWAPPLPKNYPLPGSGPQAGHSGSGTTADNSGNAWTQPDCRNQPGARCGGYDTTAPSERYTHSDQNPANRPENRPAR